MKCTCGSSSNMPHHKDCPLFGLTVEPEYWCSYCKKAVRGHCEHFPDEPTKPPANRDPVKYRYDVLYWEFIHAMAEIGHFGAEKYGDHNYRQPGLTRDKSPINHMANHLRQYLERESYDHPEVDNDRKYHLAAIAFNAMMEFYHYEQGSQDASKENKV